VMLESDTQSFRDVKLVEFPHEGAYTLGFVTTETPPELAEPAGHADMLTLFLPLAPNPVMGGHLVHMPADRVMDVDMTVEEGIRAIVTSGVAVGGGSGVTSGGLSADRLRDLGGVEHADQQFDPEQASPSVRRSAPVDTDRSESYDESIEPERATTPEDIARRERPADDSPAADANSAAERTHGNDTQDATVTPAEQAGRYVTETEETEGRPAAMADRAVEDRASTDGKPAERADRNESERESTEGAPAAAADREESDPDDTEESNEGGGRN